MYLENKVHGLCIQEFLLSKKFKFHPPTILNIKFRFIFLKFLNNHLTKFI